MPVPSSRRYFSERNGRGPVVQPLTFEQFRPLVIHVFDLMRERDYFQRAFGYECVDAGEVPGKLGSNPAAFFQLKIQRSGVWPCWDDTPPPPHGYEFSGAFDHFDPSQPWEHWDEDTMFDMVEILYDLVAKGTQGRHHDFSDCGWHYTEFDVRPARSEYREEMNAVLRLHDPPYELTEFGEVIEMGPADLHPLLEAALPDGIESPLEEKITASVARYRARSASLEERRHAVRDLVDVLEYVRKDVKDALLKKDEAALFKIANSFGIRHMNQSQQTEYDGTTWLAWMFYVSLATLHAVLPVRERQND